MTKDEIKYLALSALGYNDKPDFNDTDDNGVVVINSFYQHLLSVCIAKNKWNFFNAKSALVKATNDKNTKYKYKYPLEADLEVLNGVFTNDKYTFPNMNYEMSGGYIFTDAQKCYIEYRKKVCEETLPPYFIDYFYKFMAAELCQNITGDNNLEQALVIKAEKALIEAKALDNMQKPPRVLNTATFTSVRG